MERPCAVSVPRATRRSAISRRESASPLVTSPVTVTVPVSTCPAARMAPATQAPSTFAAPETSTVPETVSAAGTDRLRSPRSASVLRPGSSGVSTVTVTVWYWVAPPVEVRRVNTVSRVRGSVVCGRVTGCPCGARSVNRVWGPDGPSP